MNITKRFILLLVGGVLLCPSLLYLFIDGYYLPFKPCRPMVYPSGEPMGKGRRDNLVGDSFVQVVAFYDQRLQPTTQKNIIGHWRTTDRRPDIVAYACSAGDINGTTGEQGCMYLLPMAGGTRVITELNVYEGSTVPCQGP